MPVLLRLDDGYVDLERRCVVRDGRDDASLTPTEHTLLRYLAERPGHAVPLEELMREVWGYAPGVKSRAPYVAIQRLRTKLEVDAGAPKHLVSVYGSGYRLDLVDTPGPQLAAVPAPGSPTAYFGRVAERTALASAWSAGARLVTLRGPGGMGKTRLLLEHVSAGTPGLEDAPVDVVWLADVRDAAGLLAAVATALGIALPGGGDVPRQLARIGRVLRHKGRALLVLDNAEQILAPVAEAVQCWADQAPDLRVLVTSRHALDLPAEQVIDLAPLDPDAAVALLVDRAGRVRWGYAPAPEDGQLLLDLVTQDLDGLPLAIELAAARLGALDLKGVAQRLRERFRLLSGGRGDARWSSLRAALVWSWELLSVDEQGVLAQCSVFAGGFDVDAAEQVVRAGDAWVPDVLSALVDHSLMVRRDGTAGLRFHLLESVRDLARENLGDQAAAARARHRAWALSQVAPRMAELSSVGAAAAMTLLLRERANLRAAHAGALVDEDMDGAIALTEVLDTLASRRGPLMERLQRIEATLAVVPEDHPDRVALLWRHGDALRSDGRFDEARRVLEAAVEVGRPHHRTAEPLTALLAVHAQVTDIEAVKDLFDRALAAAEAQGDLRRQCIVVHNMAIVEREIGSLARAEEASLRALDIARRIGDVEMQVGVLASLASTATTAGRPEDSLARIGQAMALARAHDLHALRTTLLVNLAHLHRRMGHPEDAESTYVETMELARRIGKDRTELLVRQGRIALAFDRGHWDDALAQLDELERFQAGEQEAIALGTSILRGVVLRGSGDLRGAERELRAVRHTCIERGTAQVGDFAGVHLAAVLAEIGRLDAVEPMIEALGAAFQERDDPTGVGMLAVVQAQVHLARGEVAQAETIIAAQAGGFEEVDRLVRLLRLSQSRATNA